MIKYTPEQIEARTSDYICWDCGMSVLSDEQKERRKGHVMTVHASDCGLCGKNTFVAHIRNWNWLRLNNN